MPEEENKVAAPESAPAEQVAPPQEAPKEEEKSAE